MLSRRALGLTGLVMAGMAAAAPSALAAEAGDTAFEVWRGGKKIGAHSVRVRSVGERRTATILAEFVVHVGPVPVFRYHHEGVEVWDGPRFTSLVTRSVSNGAVETVNARRVGEGVTIQRAKGPPIIAAADAGPMTHWNREALRRPLFNPQTGALIKCGVKSRGVETVRFADGRSASATAFVITGDADITDWYDEAGLWAALKAKGPDGSIIDYRRV